jgi:hypothetical protein
VNNIVEKKTEEKRQRAQVCTTMLNYLADETVTNLALALGLQGLRHVKLGAQLCI